MSSSPRGDSTPTRRSGRTPAGNRTPSQSVIIPETPKTPSVGTTNNETETPLRIGNNRNTNSNIVVENSDSISIPPTSPAYNLGAVTSPLPAGVNMSEIDLSSPLNYGTPSSMGSVRTPRSGIRGTPLRIRPDIRTDRRMRQVNIGSDSVSVMFYFMILLNIIIFVLRGTNIESMVPTIYSFVNLIITAAIIAPPKITIATIPSINFLLEFFQFRSITCRHNGQLIRFFSVLIDLIYVLIQI